MPEQSTDERAAGEEVGFLASLLGKSAAPSLVPIAHTDGVPWYEAPLPARWHRCRPQSQGSVELTLYERCPCGATRLNGEGSWLDRNSRRRNSRRRRGKTTEPDHALGPDADLVNDTHEMFLELRAGRTTD